MKIVFTASRLYTPVEEIQRPLLVVEDGRITEISSGLGTPAPADASLVDFGEAVSRRDLSTFTFTAAPGST